MTTNTTSESKSNVIPIVNGDLTQKERKGGKAKKARPPKVSTKAEPDEVKATANGKKKADDKEKATTPEGVNSAPSSGRIAVRNMPILTNVKMPEAPSVEEMREARKRMDEFSKNIDSWMLAQVEAWNEYRENSDVLSCGPEEALRLENTCLESINKMLEDGGWRASAAFFWAAVTLADESSYEAAHTDLLWLIKGYKNGEQEVPGLLVRMAILTPVGKEELTKDQLSIRVLGRSYLLERALVESGINKEQVKETIAKIERMNSLCSKEFREQCEKDEAQLRQWANTYTLTEEELESGKPGRIFLYVPAEEGNQKSRDGHLAVESRDGRLTVKGGANGLKNFGSEAVTRKAFFPVDQIWKGKKEDGKVDFGEFLENPIFFASLNIGKFVARGIKYAQRGKEIKADQAKRQEKKVEFNRLAREKRTELAEKAKEGSFLNFLLRKPGLYFCNPAFPDGYFFNKKTQRKVFQTFFLLEILEDGRTVVRDYFKYDEEKGNGGRTEIFEPFAKEPWTADSRGLINGESSALRVLLLRWAGLCIKKLSKEEAEQYDRYLAEVAKTELASRSDGSTESVEEEVEILKPLSLEDQQELAVQLAGDEDVSGVTMPDPSDGR